MEQLRGVLSCNTNYLVCTLCKHGARYSRVGLAAKGSADEMTCVKQPFHVDAVLDAQTAEKVHKILGRNIACRLQHGS